MYTSRILFYRVAVAQEIVRCAQVVSVLILWLIVIVNLFLQKILLTLSQSHPAGSCTPLKTDVFMCGYESNSYLILSIILSIM